VIGLLAGLLASTTALPAPAFDVEGHRGTRGLAPENTLAAFARALAIGVTTLETDLAVTADGVLVISHDPLLNPDVVRAPDGRWLPGKGPAIHTLTLAQLKQYDIGRVDPASKYGRQFPEQQPADGERFPTLAELFALVRESGKPVRLNLETKITPLLPEQTVDATGFARLVVQAVRAAGMANRVTIQSFDWRTLVEAKKIAPEIETACLTIETPTDDTVQRTEPKGSAWHAGFALAAYDDVLPALVRAAGCAIWSPFWRNVTGDAIAQAHALGLRVLPWTVNDPRDMTQLIDWNVDGIITDYPDRLRGVLADRGLPLPP
jgi:glycerophosphoryl diester phosphodiesterase